MREPGFRFTSFSWCGVGDPGRLEQRNVPHLIARWLILAFSVWVASEVVSGIYLDGLITTLAVAAILGLFNLYVRPVLFLLSLPFTIITLGFFVIVINAALLALTGLVADLFGMRFEVAGVGAALLGALVISMVNLFLSLVLRPQRLRG